MFDFYLVFVFYMYSYDHILLELLFTPCAILCVMRV